MDSSFDIEKDIAVKIEEVNGERRVLKDSLDTIQTKLESAFARIGGKPKETDEDLVKSIEKLEFWHSTTTHDNASERKFMLDMDKLKKRRAALVDYAKMQISIDDLKAQKKDVQQLLKDKEKHLDGLYQAVRKLKTAGKVGCSPSDVVERVVAATEDQVPGSMYRQLTEQFGVDISTTRSNGNRAVRLQGVEDAVEAAIVRIEELLLNIAQEVPVTNSTIYCLLMCNAAMLNRIEKDHSVRIDLSRASLTCKISGLPEMVNAAISEIASIESSSVEVKYENSALPFIIGKAGSGLRAIEQENCVHLDIDRERNVITVTGFVDDVAVAAELIKGAADGNRSVEEILKIPRHIFLGCLQSDGAALLKAVRSEHPAVVIQTLKALERQKQNAPADGVATGNGGRPPVSPPKQAALDAAIGVDKSGDMSSESFEYLLFKGPAMRAIPARNFIQAALDKHISGMVAIQATPDSVGFVVGKKGVRVEAIRKKFPGSSIDVGNDVVYVHAASEEDRTAIQAEIQEIIDDNQIETMSTTDETVRSLVGTKGAQMRTQLEQSLSLNVHIDIDNTRIKLRGHRNSIVEGLVLLKEYELNHSLKEVPVSDEDCTALSSGGTESAVRQFETQHNVEIYVGRKNNIVKIRGHKDAIDAAAAAITRLLAGEAGSESQLIPYDKSDLRFLIGKGGETISKFEKENAVRIDILKSSGYMRVRGETPEHVNTAVDAITTFLGDVTDVHRIPIPDGFTPQVLKKHLDNAKQMFPLKVLFVPPTYANTGKNGPMGKSRKPAAKRKLKVKENSEEVEEDAEAATSARESPVNVEDVLDRANENVIVLQAKRRVLKPAVSFLESLMLDTEKYSYQLSERQFENVYPLLSSQSRKTGIEKFGSSLKFDVPKRFVVLENATPVATEKSKAMLFRFLDEFLPGQFATVYLPPACLSYFNAENVTKSVSSLSGVRIQYDFHGCCLRISSENEHSILNAIDMIEAHRSQWSERYVIIELDDATVIPYLVGKGGAFISDAEKTCAVTIQIDSKNNQVVIQGRTKDTCAEAEQKIKNRIAQYAKEHWKDTVDDIDALGSLIGKGGTKINQMRTDTGANIEINLEAGSIRVTGPEEAVLKAKTAIQAALKGHLSSNCVLKLKIPIAAFPLIVGKKGVTIQDLQTSTKVRKIDLNRDTEELVIRGSAENCAAAEEKVKTLLDDAGFNKEPVIVVSLPEVPVAAHEELLPTSVEKLPSSSGYLKSNGNPVVMSKSYLKRLRRKEAQARGDCNQTEEESDFDDKPLLNGAAVVSSDSGNSSANANAVSELLTEMGVSARNIDIAPAMSPDGQPGATETVRSPIVQPISPTIPSTLAASAKGATISTEFTPFSGPSVVPSPVYDTSPGINPSLKSAAPPGIAAPVRSMRSARVGIIGSAGTGKITEVAADENHSVRSGVSSVEATSTVSVTALAIPSPSVPASSADSLLSLLLEDSGVAQAPVEKSFATGNSSTHHISLKVSPSVPSSEGYYKSKGGFSVRLN